MGHPCSYFLGISFSKICGFNREFETKSFCGGKSIIRRSSVTAIYQNKPLSPVSFFDCRNGLLFKNMYFSYYFLWLMTYERSDHESLEMIFLSLLGCFVVFRF